MREGSIISEYRVGENRCNGKRRRLKNSKGGGLVLSCPGNYITFVSWLEQAAESIWATFSHVLAKRSHRATERDIRGSCGLNKTHQHTPEKLLPFKRSTIPNCHMTVTIMNHIPMLSLFHYVIAFKKETHKAEDVFLFFCKTVVQFSWQASEKLPCREITL